MRLKDKVSGEDAMSMPLKPFRWYKELATKKGRLEAGAFLVEGDRAIKQIISSHPGEIIEILTVEEPLPVYRHYTVRLVTERQFRSICHTRTPQGTMAVVRLPVDIYSGYLPEDAGNKILLLEDIQDPGNVGTLIRTAAAFDFSGVIMTESCADPLSPLVLESMFADGSALRRLLFSLSSVPSCTAFSRPGLHPSDCLRPGQTQTVLDRGSARAA